MNMLDDSIWGVLGIATVCLAIFITPDDIQL